VARVRLRIYLGEDEHKLGPGKVQLLEAIREHGSISAAARSMGMAYRHAWELVDDLNRCFQSPAVAASTGGRAGGGAEITPLGEELIRRFHAMEKATRRAIGRDLEALDAKLAAGPRNTGAGKDRAR
jgi:molybdate transport system regulatory protein